VSLSASSQQVVTATSASPSSSVSGEISYKLND
jgi:hypothetical protein